MRFMKTRSILIALFLIVALVPMALTAGPATWKNVSLVDTNCHGKFTRDADAHTRACALKCERRGFGIITSDGTWLPFDAKGNDLAVAALESSNAKDHLRVTVVGEQKGDQILVQSLQLN